jgi:hypothetical protein
MTTAYGTGGTDGEDGREAAHQSLPPRHDHGAQPGFTAPIVLALGGFPSRRMRITPGP